MTKTLMRMYWQMSRNTYRFAPTKTKVTYVILGLLATLVILMFSLFIGNAASSLPDRYVGVLFSYLFAGLFGFVILIGVPQVFKDLYSATELSHLFTLPIPTRNIFWVKYMQSFVAVPGFIWLISVVLLTVYGIAARASFLFYPISYVTTLAIILIGMSVTYLINLVMVQIIPASRTKELMTAMSAFAGLFGYLSFQLPNMYLSNAEGDDIFTSLPSLPSWLPFTWGGDAIAHAKIGGLSSVLPFLFTILLAMGMILLATTLVERGFRTGWIRLSEGSSKKKKRKRVKQQNKLTHPVIFIGKKEWWIIKRDMREWMTILPFVFFMIFPFVFIIDNKEALDLILAEPLISWTIVQVMFLFMFTLVGSTMGSSTIGREGSSLYVIQTLPLSSLELVLGKFWISWLIPIVPIVLFEIILGTLFNWSIIYVILAIVFFMFYGLGVTALGLWLGTLGARYNPSNPQQRLKVGVSFLLMFVTFVYMGLTMMPLLLTFIPYELLLTEEGFDVTANGMIGKLTVIAQWKMNNQLLVKSIGVILSLFVVFGTVAITLFFSVTKINKGIEIDVVGKK